MSDLCNAIYLVTGINQTYLTRAEAYIASMDRYSTLNNVVITLDFEIPRQYRERHPSIQFIQISSGKVESPNCNSCMQHGGFLSALDFLEEKDIVVYTDADIQMQRRFCDDELRVLHEHNDDEIGVSLNRSEDDWLSEEAGRLECNVSMKDLNAVYPGIHELRTYNTGVLVANYRTYKRLYAIYNRRWTSFQRLFESYAKQQWLLSYLIQKHFKPKLLPDTIHTHGHYPVKLRVHDEAGYKFCIGCQPVVLSHAIRHPAEELISRLERENLLLNTQINRRTNRRIRRLRVALIIAVLSCMFMILRDLLWG